MVIAGPNVSIDREIGLGRLDPGHIHRARRVVAKVGGGGVNAARTVARLERAATLVTVLPERDEQGISGRLTEEGLEVSWVRCKGEVRLATIVREESGRISVFGEPGADLGSGEWEEFVRIALMRLVHGRVLLCTGSIPPGAPTDGYARMAWAARHAGSRCVVDVAGRALEATLESGEGLLVPNLAEAEGVLSGSGAEPVHGEGALERAAEVAGELLRRGASAVVVTAGAAGAAYAERGPRGARGWIAAPAALAVNPIGAGDAFAAALAVQIQEGQGLGEAVEFAVAVAAEHVASRGGEGVAAADAL